MPAKLNEWFCLKAGRDNFKPDNTKDRNLLLCHGSQLSDEILSSIEQRFAVNEPVKMLIYGDWGVGKTHAINHICWWLESHAADYPSQPIVIEIGDVKKTSKFDVIVKPFVEKLGLTFLIDLAHKYLPLSNGGIVAGLGAAGVSPQVADAFGKLLMATPGGTPPPVVQHAFEYLKGRKPPSADLGFGPQLTESVDLYSVLLGIGQMYRAVNQSRILFIADEAAKVEAVDADDASQAHWVNANKLVFDDKNNVFGFVYTISARRKQLPRALFEPQLQNRLGEDKAFELKNLQPADVTKFLTELITNFVDKPTVDQLVSNGTIPAADYDWDAFPFTSVAKTEFIDFFSRSQEKAKPRDICDKLNDVAFIALKSNKRLIDPDCLRKAKM